MLMLSRSNVLKGARIVLSGLIPLGQDPMRYVNSLNRISKAFVDVLILIMYPRSDIVTQATGFGATIQTKYVILL